MSGIRRIHTSEPVHTNFAAYRELVPGLALSAAVAVAAVAAAAIVGPALPVPAMVIALLIGLAFNRLAARPLFRPGLIFCVKEILRWSVALLGLRIALGDIMSLGLAVAALTIAAMIVTLISGFMIARLLRLNAFFGALVGSATAVCGASAALATATVLPNYPHKERDVVFVVIAANSFATAAMLLYPPICVALGFDAQATGVLLGGTIHDVAQVVGAGYAVSEAAGNTAVIVKLFRVFLLLPVVLCVGWWVAGASARESRAHVPVPVFAVMFLVLCVVNSAMPLLPAPYTASYEVVRDVLIGLSSAGLLLAIGALGLSTSVAAMVSLGWRHIVAMTFSTLVIFVMMLAGLAAWR